MPDPITHTKIVAPVVGGSASWFLGFAFDISRELVAIVFIGCFIGLLFRDAIPDFTSKLEALKHFMKTLLVLIAATVVTAWVAQEFISRYPNISAKTIAGLTGFIFIYFQATIANASKAAIVRLFGKVGA